MPVRMKVPGKNSAVLSFRAAGVAGTATPASRNVISTMLFPQLIATVSRPTRHRQLTLREVEVLSLLHGSRVLSRCALNALIETSDRVTTHLQRQRSVCDVIIIPYLAHRLHRRMAIIRRDAQREERGGATASVRVHQHASIDALCSVSVTLCV